MAKKTSENFTLNTRGRGGGYENNKDGGNRGTFKRLFLREPANEEDDAILMTYKVDQDTEENELVLLDDINILDSKVVVEDVVLWDGLDIAGVGFNTLSSDDDPKGGVFDPICDMLRKNPHIQKTEKYVKFPQFGIVFSGIDRNEYEIKKGERQGDIVADRRKLVFITQRYIEALIRDIRNGCKKAGVKSLRGTVWHISRAACNPKQSIYTPKIGDRWDFVKQLSEDELIEEFADAAADAKFDRVEDFVAPIDYETVLEPIPYEEREEIAELILNHVGGSQSSRDRGSRGRSGGGKPRSARAGRSSRGSSRPSRSSDESSDEGSRSSKGGSGSRVTRGGRAGARKRTYTEDEPSTSQVEEKFFDEDDDVPF